MALKKELGNMCTCDICGNEISKITQTQQTRSSAQKWSKYGLCSVACSSKTDVLRKLTESDSIKNPRNKFYGKSFLQIKRFANQDYRAGVSTVKNYEFSKKVNKYCDLIIFIGKLIAIISLFVGFYLFYSESFVGALISLIPIVTGIILYRLGVWRKCKTR